MKKIFSLAAMAILGLSARAQQPTLPIIPKPQEAVVHSGQYRLTASATLAAPKALQRSANALNRYLQQFYGFKLSPAKEAGAANIMLALATKSQPIAGAYTLEVTAQGVRITGDDAAGVFYGVQSLLQLLPAPQGKAQALAIPAVTIKDAPRFGYRGMMLDVGRHFQPVAFIKKTLDHLAMLKINTFHWHLTEDQGWRIEIKKYPKLTTVGAWRDGTIIGRYPGTGNDNTRYGGYYTQEEIKEIVQYAAERYITVIPEIEMPGHSSAAIAAYPFLSCFPEEETVIKRNASAASQAKKGKKVQETWGVFEDVFVPSEQTFRFLQDVIDEIVPLFPSRYIHIGGDECPKEAWKRSAFCQQLIKEKGLKDEHELQSYFIRRMEQYINSKGKQIIGWDEILEGGLAPNATVMSWRGEQGGIDAARQRHNVIMSPNSHCYLDHSQTRNEDSVTIGGFTTLDKLYSYDPMPAALKGTEFEGFVKGVQANVWTEYMRSPEKVEYMIFPRLAALSEAAWTQQANREWNDFAGRIPAFLQRLDRMQTRYSRAFFEINSAIVPAEDGSGIRWKLDSRYPNARILVTPPGGTPTVYQQPIPVQSSGTWQAVLQEDGKTLNTISQVFSLHKATGRTITVNPKTARQYSGQGGVQGLVNGVTSQHGLSSNEWCGWQGADVEATIDMGKAEAVNNVVLHTIEANGSWIHRPSQVQVLLSSDGASYAPAGTVNCKELPANGQGLRQVEIPVRATTRYIRLLVKHAGTIPAGMEGAGHPAWLFIDEIEVN